MLAGGKATRLRPITSNVPKVLLPVAGEPFAAYQLRWLAHQGVSRATYCVGFLGGQVRDFIGDGARFGVAVDYVDEGETLLGTGGALRLAVDNGKAGPGPFLLTYGDSLLDIDVGEVWARYESSGREALMVVLENDGRFGPNNASYADEMVARYDKSAEGSASDTLTHIDYGLSIFRPETIRDEIPAGVVYDLAQLQARLSRAGRLAGFVASRPFHEIGSVEGWRALDVHLSEPGPR